MLNKKMYPEIAPIIDSLSEIGSIDSPEKMNGIGITYNVIKEEISIDSRSERTVTIKNEKKSRYCKK